MCCCLSAQDSSERKISFRSSTFIDTYYSYDFNEPTNHEKPPFIYNYNRHHEFSVNLALLTASYNADRIRANIGIMAGTYSQYNLASEQEVFRHLYEANMGVKLSEKRELWIDVGIMPSHIGFESAISKDCWTLTRSILAENSPYYEAGLKISYNSPASKWYVSALLLNGWQRIKRIEGNNTPAFGTQLTFKPSEKVLFNWSTFAGNDKPDSVKRMRYFNNSYCIIQLSKKFGITLGLDAGLEQKQKKSSDFNAWYAWVILLRYEAQERWHITGRLEHYYDKNGVIVPSVGGQPFQMTGLSVNMDHTIRKNLLWRVEGRWLQNSHPYFTKGTAMVRSNTSFTTGVAITIR